MKVRIEKEINIKGEGYFNIYADDKFICCTSFHPNLDTNSPTGENTKFEEAKKIAHALEEGKTTIKEIVYETK